MRAQEQHDQGSRAALSFRVPVQLKVALQKLAEADRRRLGPYLVLALEAHVEAAKQKEKRR